MERCVNTASFLLRRLGWRLALVALAFLATYTAMAATATKGVSVVVPTGPIQTGPITLPTTTIVTTVPQIVTTVESTTPTTTQTETRAECPAGTNYDPATALCYSDFNEKLAIDFKYPKLKDASTSFKRRALGKALVKGFKGKVSYRAAALDQIGLALVKSSGTKGCLDLFNSFKRASCDEAYSYGVALKKGRDEANFNWKPVGGKSKAERALRKGFQRGRYIKKGSYTLIVVATATDGNYAEREYRLKVR